MFNLLENKQFSLPVKGVGIYPYIGDFSWSIVEFESARSIKLIDSGKLESTNLLESGSQESLRKVIWDISSFIKKYNNIVFGCIERHFCLEPFRYSEQTNILIGGLLATSSIPIITLSDKQWENQDSLNTTDKYIQCATKICIQGFINILEISKIDG